MTHVDTCPWFLLTTQSPHAQITTLRKKLISERYEVDT
jgi:hypothetical protein